MMRLLSVKTRRRDRISADEEERQRAGHEIVTTIRFEPHGERSGATHQHVTDDGGHELGDHDLRRHRADPADERRSAPPQEQGRPRATCWTPSTAAGQEADLAKNVHR